MLVEYEVIWLNFTANIFVFFFFSEFLPTKISIVKCKWLATHGKWPENAYTCTNQLYITYSGHCRPRHPPLPRYNHDPIFNGYFWDPFPKHQYKCQCFETSWLSISQMCLHLDCAACSIGVILVQEGCTLM